MTKEQEELLLKQGKMLPVMEHFYTIQGEGFHAGKAAYFIRLGGCDVGCHWCDVKESWDPKLHPLMDATEIAETAAKHCKTIVLTGGEPLMWNLEILTSRLIKAATCSCLGIPIARMISGVGRRRISSIYFSGSSKPSFIKTGNRPFASTASAARPR